MRFATIFIAVAILLPMAGLLLYTAIHPKESALWGIRWKLKNNDLEPSDDAVKYNRTASIIALAVVLISLVVIIIKA